MHSNGREAENFRVY